MVDGVLLLVDAVEGPMPQTKFVLRKAVEKGLKPIVFVNKMDRPHIRPAEVVDEVSCLLIDLGADEELLDFPVFFGSAKLGWVSADQKDTEGDLSPLMDCILDKVPAPKGDSQAPLRMQVTMLDHSSYRGRIGIGRISQGRIKVGDPVICVRPGGTPRKAKVTRLEGFVGLTRIEIKSAQAGDIVTVAGVEDVDVGETIASPESPEPFDLLEIDPPTLSMEFMVNTSPFAGREGDLVTARNIKNRLQKEQQLNVGLKIEELAGEGHFKVSGRGELHLSVLIESMRREGFELAVSRPEVICVKEDGKWMEPTEYLILEIESQYQGVVFEMLGTRGGKLQNMQAEGDGLRLEYILPARSLIGFKSMLMTETRGTGIMHHSFHGYAPKSGDRGSRKNGVLVAMEEGTTTAYALANLEERATLFIGPAVEVYEGMIVALNSRDVDMVVNPCKGKALTNIRSKSSDEAVNLTPPRTMSLEDAIEFIAEDELVEVTPKSIRLRKKFLAHHERKRAEKQSA
jgi:GTP-binding protein